MAKSTEKQHQAQEDGALTRTKSPSQSLEDTASQQTSESSADLPVNDLSNGVTASQEVKVSPHWETGGRVRKSRYKPKPKPAGEGMKKLLELMPDDVKAKLKPYDPVEVEQNRLTSERAYYQRLAEPEPERQYTPSQRHTIAFNIAYNKLSELVAISKHNYEDSERQLRLLHHITACRVDNEVYDKQHRVDTRLGVLLYGKVGCGKTSLMQSLEVTTVSLKMPVYSCNRLAETFSKSGREAIDKFIRASHDLCFDDLGDEKETKNYGDLLNFSGIITARYEVFNAKGLKTYFTTNLSLPEILDRYGERAFDRLMAMCNPIRLPDDFPKFRNKDKREEVQV